MTAKEALATLDRILHHKRLTPLHEFVFCQSWDGKTYQEMADEAGYDYDYIKEIGSWLWHFVSEMLGVRVTKKNLQTVLRSYKHEAQEAVAVVPETKLGLSRHQRLALAQDWGTAPDVSQFYGRTDELTLLEQWIVRDRCRMVALLGIGGIGKTALSVTLAEEIQCNFKFIFWRSLHAGESMMMDWLAEAIRFLAGKDDIPLPEAHGDRISRLVQYMQNHRCLLVLDGAECLLKSGDFVGSYLSESELYGDLFRRLGEAQHQSCLLITSREQLREFTLMEGTRVRSLYIRNLNPAEGQEIFAQKGDFSAAATDWEFLVDQYAGNPLLLKIVAAIVQEFFASDIHQLVERLQYDRWLFEDIRALLEPQFARLSEIGKKVMYWLSVLEEIPSPWEIEVTTLPTRSTPDFLTVLDSLRRRSLIVRTNNGYRLPPVVLEYVSEYLVQQVYRQ